MDNDLNIITVAIADDHYMVREGLRTLLEQETDIRVVGEAGNGREAVALVTGSQPDVIVMDVSMPEMNGIEATRTIRVTNSRTRVVMLSMNTERRYIVDAINAGAHGYLLKDASFKELADAVRAVASGDTCFSPRINELIIRDYLMRVPDGLPLNFESLSEREREMLALIAEGRNTKELALMFDISMKTVDVHRHNIMKKLNLFTIAELTKFAVREGLTPLH